MLDKIVTYFKNKKYIYSIEADRNYYYTNSDKDVLILGNLYTAEYISHSSIKSSMNEVRAAVQLTLDINNPFCQNLIQNNITKNIRVNIIEIYNDVRVPIFFGEVEEISIERNEVVISVAPVSLFLKSTANRYGFSSACNHRFTSKACSVNANDQENYAIVSATENKKTVIQVSFTDEKMKNGTIISANEERRMILDVNVSENKLTLISNLNVEINERVRIINGCNKTSETCKKYGGNFLGFEFVPSRNIFTEGMK